MNGSTAEISGRVSSGSIDATTANGEDKPETNGEGAALVTKKSLSKSDCEIIRLIGQHLRDLGLQRSVDELVKESGCAMEHPVAAKFRSYVLRGNWDESFTALEDLKPLLVSEKKFETMKFLMLEEKYMEMLESKHVMEALQCLRGDITPMEFDTGKVHKLSSYMMCNGTDDLKMTANWPGIDGGARQKLMDTLQSFLPASAMLPPRRLQQLLGHALEWQASQCVYHNTSWKPELGLYSLLTDHICTRNQFPSECHHSLEDHTDEVIHLQFSHNGKRLATGSKDSTVILWNVEDPGDIKKVRTLQGHPFGIAWVQWSPDDQYILACGEEDSSEVFIWTVETGELKCRFSHNVDDSLSSAAWYGDSQRFVAAGIKGQFYQCNIDGNMLESWEGVRVHCVAVVHNQQPLVLAADTHMRVKAYNFESLTTAGAVVQEDHPIMSFTVSSDGRLVLLNIASQGLHLWDMKDAMLIKRYQGISQGFYTIHSCFGGVNEDFIASGSEDHKVYIWHKQTETPIMVLSGHTRTVNAVSWNPKNPSMLASAGDDGYVKVWGPARESHEEASNGQDLDV
eukprot:m.12198 g.12198  ORF g.12198 m.12198 type:complete len:568 (+) comp23868_c0_seq1:226-1929(+)